MLGAKCFGRYKIRMVELMVKGLNGQKDKRAF